MASLPLLLKTLHVLMATVFFGTGAGVAFVKLRADHTGDVRIIAWANRFVVQSDLIFTIPSGVLMPVTGLALAWQYGTSWATLWATPWLVKGLIGWSIAGAFWLPAWRLQYRMSALATTAFEQGTALPEAYHRYTRWWMFLGFPSFTAALWTFWVMVSKG